jgi:hypothetical protein
MSICCFDDVVDYRDIGDTCIYSVELRDEWFEDKDKPSLTPLPIYQKRKD